MSVLLGSNQAILAGIERGKGRVGVASPLSIISVAYYSPLKLSSYT
jgi:hypothetical protein